ncbi:hypothetical protein ACFOW1_12035 [Parasediminibacterium paludis]|uniref:DUF4178 domain-containing protein n=1 Tax=Parasediminibacterium paludis TaxID=908966 RepID=A0ABV8PZQ9_9BACT
MSKTLKSLLFVGTVFFLFISVVTISRIYSNKQLEQKQKILYKALGNLHFKGKVINISLIDRYSKKYSMLCIKLDYSNRESIYYFENDYFLKIKNGIATLPDGLFLSDSKIIDYVEVDMNSEKKEILHYKDGSVEEYGYFVNAGWLYESDVNICN